MNPQSSFSKPILTVQALNHAVKEALEGQFSLIWVEGEVSNLKKPSSGHWYFSLKDAASQIRCVCFKQHTRKLTEPLVDGTQVVVYARVSVYEPRGDYQLMVQGIEFAGEGQLQRAYELLKKRLLDEGLFDTSHKKKWPSFPQRVGVITSASAAALRDVLRVLNRRCPAIEVIVYPSLVQGDQASDNLIRSLEIANQRNECDVLLMVRGGGSLEDLWSFNSEDLARAIAKSHLPIVTGIGHQIDFTIADFVADWRAATPSAAAECVSPNQKELMAVLQGQSTMMLRCVGNLLTANENRLKQQAAHLKHPGEHLQALTVALSHMQQLFFRAMLRRYRQHIYDLVGWHTRLHATPLAHRIESFEQILKHLLNKLNQMMINALEERFSDLKRLSQAKELLNPRRVLGRGYAWVVQGDQIIGSVLGIEKGSQLTIELSDGQLGVQVKSINTDNS